MATASPSEPGAAAAEALRLVRSRPPTLGEGRLLCIDGPAGSGKTTLAAAVAALEPAAVVVHTDDLLDGWGDLPGLPARLEALLAPLGRGEPSSYLRYDWVAGRYAGSVPVAPGPLLVVEGVGAGCRATAPWRTTLVWVSAPDDLRLARGLARDGAALEPQWRRWLVDEAAHFRAERTADRAEMRVETGPRG